MKRNPYFGHQHSRIYKKTVISDFLESIDKDGECVKVHSDIHLLLRQKKIQDTIGLESLRQYIDKIERPNTGPRPQLSDAELMTLIEPRELNTITDMYQYSRFIQDNEAKMLDKYNQLKEAHKRQQNLFTFVKDK